MEVAGKYDLPKGYLSASAIELFLKCPKQYEFRYIRELRKPSNKALSFGSIAHVAFAEYYREVLDTGTRLSGGQLAELTMDVSLPEWFSSNENDVTADERNDIERAMPQLVSAYVENVGRHVVPIAVESEIRHDMSCGVPILAYLDLVHDTGDSFGIIDYKITGKPWKIDKLVNSLQFMLYSHITGTGDVQIHNLITPATGRRVSMNSDAYVSTRDRVDTYQVSGGTNLNFVGHKFDIGSQENYLEDMVERVATGITTGVFPHSHPGTWWCTSRFCDFWDQCRGCRGR